LQVLLKLVEQYHSRVSCTSGLRSGRCRLSKNGMASPQHRGRRGSSDDKLFQGSQPALHPVCSRPGTSWIRRILDCHVPFHTDSNEPLRDRKSTRLNSSHQIISYAVFCLKKKNPHN